MKLTLTTVANVPDNFNEDDITDIKEDLEDSLRYYGGKGVHIEAKVDQ